MTIETASYISDLVATLPGPADPKSEGDDHLRLLKSVLQTTFPNIKGVMPIAHDHVASTDYVNQTAFNTALPGQPGGTTTYNLTSTGAVASWQPASIFSNSTLLAQAQATALCF